MNIQRKTKQKHESQKIHWQMKAFLNKGNSIKVIDPGVSGVESMTAKQKKRKEFLANEKN